MNTFRKLGLAVLALACAGSVWAHRPYHRHHPHTTVGFGFVFGPPYYPYPYPHPVFWPPVVVPQPIVVQPAPVYIEQQPAPPAQTLEPGYWYWCGEAKAYYPDVKACPGAWQKIAPRPAP